MQALKIIGIILLVVILFFVGFLFTLDGEGHLERTTTINAPVEKVYDVVSDFSHNKHWYPWFKIDPETKYEFSENTSGTGASYSWSSEHPEVMTGSQEITEAVPNEFVNTRMNFGDMTGDYKASFLLKELDDNSTELTWTYDGKADVMMEKIFIEFFIESFLGEQYESGLADLKSYIEDLPEGVPELDIIESDSSMIEQ